MKISAAIRAVCPPILWTALDKRLGRRQASQTDPSWIVEFRGSYATFNDALAASGDYPADQEQGPAAPRGVFPQDGYFDNRELGAFAAIACAMAHASENRRVVDFGGGPNAPHFQTYRKAFSEPVEWTVVEPETVASQAAEKWRHDDNVRFASDPRNIAEEPDLLIASGVLQILEFPYLELGKLLKLRPAYAYFARLPLVSGDDRCSVQHVGSAYFGRARNFPVWFFSRERFISTVTDGYEIVYRYAASNEAYEFDAQTVAFEAVLLRRL